MSRDASSISLSEALLVPAPGARLDARPPAGRRALLGGLLGLGGLGLGGCGFSPMYGTPGAGPGGGPRSAAAAAELGAVQVALIPERSGQMLRRALQERLWAGGQASPRYTLNTYLSFNVEQEGIRTSGLATRVRYTAIATWSLVTNTVPAQAVANGSERTLDAYNIPDNQFFAGDAARDAMVARLVEQVADDVVQRLAVRFSAQATG